MRQRRQWRQQLKLRLTIRFTRAACSFRFDKNNTHPLKPALTETNWRHRFSLDANEKHRRMDGRIEAAKNFRLEERNSVCEVVSHTYLLLFVFRRGSSFSHRK